MRNLLLLTCLLFMSFAIISKDNLSIKAKKGPFIINYVSPQPPDSICDFVTSYFKIKKVDVITKNTDLKTIFRDKAAVIESAILSYNDDQTGMSFSDKVLPIIESPMSYMLYIKTYQDTTNKQGYILDSIRWDIKPIPNKDSTLRFKTFTLINKPDNTFIFFKEFIDYIVKNEL